MFTEDEGWGPRCKKRIDLKIFTYQSVATVVNYILKMQTCYIPSKLHDCIPVEVPGTFLLHRRQKSCISNWM